ncbi:MAG: bifunctional pyr operon transcriptional regulator/uracil phosphoribosyltransferase PyrR [candidate division Zixibacteria bacterium]|nr:bifunctional pyr operon transcriptional regulator/uracil phosphoribosyltransferase PyrR [candidate division Zixibacteria bacterium]
MASATNSEKILDEKGISRAIKRIAHEIIERNHGADDVALVGILTRGAELAERLRDIIRELEGVEVDFGLMDINLYRDDAATRLDQPIIQKTEILFDMSERNIVLVDDVLFTGRTVRAAIDQLIDFGRPKTIQLAVLIDRGHRELPIRADYVGKNAPTSRYDDVQVMLKNTDNAEEVCIRRIKRPGAKKAARKKN